ncbi:elongation factor G [Companilactobacillus halodurans]|uniref:TetM/TetW/TetO/TetS family tetracycline resistance ribosomal protection protein n=1 Tax=Companilactobacillus halodurans TaxID=2584183 RepID=A0A5P0ZPI6_9LACO|nr:TetM/TetW/TetO/TetS family tetracycline resistance ribosomal protection protein [Companilactobacillus halodurans]MQS76164.1 TetM/TetW/TetO/TetS family tetracycline resistance ribosomal protection protein [Companilactobacillus halodurans]MQS98229.1 TetM/TetW/TetO/TetS family tetracycline resistance ribosomal protection protein [Companilactobacillus halodurans]
MKQIVTGIVAHVDAGKTTLSEALLYEAGGLRKLGRVDKGSAFLDSDDLEKKRGITIFSHQANLQYQDFKMTLLDTPGHVDFATQTEQVLSVLDYAILVISATDGIQGYTRTLWHLLQQYQIPTFIFINKTDALGVDKKKVLKQLQTELSGGCIAFGTISSETYEEIAMQDDTVLEQFLESETVSKETILKMIQERQVFPCYFGSALKLSGITEFLDGFKEWTKERSFASEFGARVFKVSHDEGERLTWVRVLGGTLHNKSVLLNDEKANQLRVYNGSKFELRQEIPAGGVCAITGLDSAHPGMGLGQVNDVLKPTIQPVLNYSLNPNGNDIHACLNALKQLEEEDPQLHVTWSNHLQEIHVQIMGEVQLEVLQQILEQRFDLKVDFDQGNVLYKETITEEIEGVGHFEPLRHYAEVHLLMQPAPRGSGLTYDSQLSLDIMPQNWQHQIQTSFFAKEHLGVLTGSPITDMKITLVNGKGSIVHSVGGDFREATWRAIRQGLMMAKQEDACQLLEPWYRFRLEIPQEQVGKAMNDIQKMDGKFDAPQINDSNSLTLLSGVAPVSSMQGYAKEVSAYTHGQGNLECIVDGYRPCHNEAEVVEKRQYQPVSDLENTPDSVFCAHGAGYPVAWDKVPGTMHLPYSK